MYSEHVPIINGAMRADVETFKRGVLFAVLSARQPFSTLPDQLKEVRQAGAKARCLWSWKIDAYRYLMEHAEALHVAACGAASPEACVKALCQIPGLGLVKGAFVAQMLGHDVACLDVRNVQREGRNPRAFRTDGKKTGAAFERKLARYVSETLGRARELWDTWCAEVGPDYGMTGHEASLLHVTCIVPKRLRHLTCAPQIANELPF